MAFKDAVSCGKCGRKATKSSNYKWCYVHEKQAMSPGRPPASFNRTPKVDLDDLIAEKRKDREELLDMSGDIAAVSAFFDHYKAKFKTTLEKAAEQEGGLTAEQEKDLDVQIDGLVGRMFSIVEKRTAMIERYYKAEKTKSTTLTEEQMGVFLLWIAQGYRKIETDKEKRSEFAGFIRKIPKDAIMRGIGGLELGAVDVIDADFDEDALLPAPVIEIEG